MSLLLLLIPTLIAGDCTCESESEERDKSQALKYKIAAIASILVASAIGVSLPILGKIIPALHPDKNFFFLIKAFAAGVILATGFIHVLPDAFESLTSPCLKEHPWAEFPFTGFVAMVSAIGTLMIDTYANSYYSQKSKRTLLNNNTIISVTGDEEKNTTVDTGNHVHVHAHNHGSVAHNHLHVHAHNHGPVAHHSDASQLVRHRVISQVLELGIVVHSVIIGISLGASESPKTIKPLVAALTFHQFFEGMGLGGCITQAKFKTRGVIVMALFFSLTTPIGIGIGLGITNVYDENSTTALIVEGIFNAASAGILIYMALVDLLSADFMSPKLQNNGRLQLGANVSLLFGAGCMSLLAKWA